MLSKIVPPIKRAVLHESVRFRYLVVLLALVTVSAGLVAFGATEVWWRFLMVFVGLWVGLMTAVYGWVRYVPWRLHTATARIEALERIGPAPSTVAEPATPFITPSERQLQAEAELIRADLRLELARQLGRAGSES